MQRFAAGSTRATPQRERVPGRSDQVANTEGGFVFEADSWAKLNRFLIIGTEGGSYYASERALDIENVANVIGCIQNDGLRVVRELEEVSWAGRAAKNAAALFVLALCASQGSAETKAAAFAAIPRVARIGTHLFHLMIYLRLHRGISGGVQKALRAWYLAQDADKLAYQLVKYRQRDGWTHRDVLRLAHPKVAEDDAKRQALLAWTCGKDYSWDNLPEIVRTFIKLQDETADRAALIKAAEGAVAREMLPTDALKDAAIWRALLPSMPMGAMIRNLGVLTKLGILRDGGNVDTLAVCGRLRHAEAVQKARIHPISVLMALKVYQAGHGWKGSLTWSPSGDVIDALNDAFELAFDNVEPAGKRTMVGLDVSGSMYGAYGSMGQVDGVPGLVASEVAAAFCKVLAREPGLWVTAFSHELVDIPIGFGSSSLAEIQRTMRSITMGGTDCSLPMRKATREGLLVDTFVILTDNETHSGRSMHPYQALLEYRRSSGIEARLAVFAFSANKFTIADPRDGGMMDFAGLDAAMPRLLAEFSKGSL